MSMHINMEVKNRAEKIEQLSKMKIYEKYRNKNGKIIIANLFDDFLDLAMRKPEALLDMQVEKGSELQELVEENQENQKKVNELILAFNREVFNKLEHLIKEVEEIKKILSGNKIIVPELEKIEDDDEDLFSKVDNSGVRKDL